LIDFLLAMVYEQRYKDLLHQAQANNINRTIQIKPSGSQEIYRQILVRLGRLFLIWGWRLQSMGGFVTKLPHSYSKSGKSI